MKRVEINETMDWDAELDPVSENLEIRVGTETYRIENPETGEAIDVKTGEKVLVTIDDPFCLTA